MHKKYNIIFHIIFFAAATARIEHLYHCLCSVSTTYPGTNDKLMNVDSTGTLDKSHWKRFLF